jgi:hypothetical protein
MQHGHTSRRLAVPTFRRVTQAARSPSSLRDNQMPLVPSSCWQCPQGVTTQ